jgi:hypothetical protein
MFVLFFRPSFTFCTATEVPRPLLAIMRSAFNGAADDADAIFSLRCQEASTSSNDGWHLSSATPPRQRCFFTRGAGGVQGVFDAHFLFIHWSRAARLDYRDSAGQLRDASSAFPCRFAGGVLDLLLEQAISRRDSPCRGAVNDCVLSLSITTRLGGKVGKGNGSSLRPTSSLKTRPPGEDGDVFELACVCRRSPDP